MKKFTFLIMSVMLSSILLAGPIGGTYSGGSGESGDPYKIATTDDLIELSNTSDDWGADFIQTADITFNSDETLVDWDGDGSADGSGTSGFSPIGNNSTSFSGSYDGQNHAISNLYINRASTDYVGLFGKVGYQSGPEIKNLRLIEINITGNNNVGALVGYKYGYTISNCYVSTGTVTGNNSVGGLIGFYMYFDMEGCFTDCTVIGNDYVGGLIGSTFSGGEDPFVKQSFSLGNVSGQSNVGGVVGSNSLINYKNCYASGDVTRTSGSETNFGGFCGSTSQSDIQYSYSTGRVYSSPGNLWGDGDGLSDNKGFIGAGAPYTCLYTANFFDSEASNQSTATGATGKTTSVMQTQSTFTNAGWDFTSTWVMPSSITLTGYPTLQWTGAYAQEPGGSPYQIANLPNLVWLEENSSRWSYDYEQTADIDASTTVIWNDGQGFIPVGNTTTAFTGSYNGQSYSIQNLFINRPDESNVGLFGLVSNSSITNVKIIGLSVTGRDDVGTLIGDIDNSTIDNCSASADVTCSGNDGGEVAGGLIGKSDQTSISNSSATGSVTGPKFSGGLIGMSLTGSIDGCYAEGTVKTTLNGYAGGLVGDNDDASIRNSHATGSVTGQNDVGGLLGDNEGPVTDCYAEGQVSATGGDVGGLIGDHDVSDVTVCYATGTVDAGGDDAGGLIGYVHGGATISKCYTTGAVNADENVGGIAGKMIESSSIQNSYCKNTSVSGTYDVGGIAGDMDNSSIENSYAVNDVSASSSTENSGIAGYVSGGATITASFFDKTVNTGMPDENDYGRSTSDMQSACTFFISDWDLAPSGGSTGTWTIDEGATLPDNDGYPALEWQSLTNNYTTDCQAASITFSSVEANQMTIGWTNGGGAARAVFMKQASTGTASPVDGTTYSAGTTFGDGTQIGTSGWYCIYNGTGSQVMVTGLTGETGYIFHATEYNGSTGSENYLTTSATENPKTQATPSSATPGLWTGATSSDWSTASNWDDENVPASTVDVTIPSGCSNYPAIDETATCQNITIEDGGEIDVNASCSLEINGDFSLNEGGSFTNNGTLQFRGDDCYLYDNRATKTTLGNVQVGE